MEYRNLKYFKLVHHTWQTNNLNFT